VRKVPDAFFKGRWRAVAVAVAAFAMVLCVAGVATPADAAPAGGPLAAVSCVSAKFCVAVGNGTFDSKVGFGPPISLIWNGVKWRRVTMKVPAGAAGTSVLSVSCRSAAWCVAVGATTFNGGRAFAQTWNGRTWTLALLPRPAGFADAVLDGVSCAAVRACVAVG
jgi:hypothetical protein